MAFPGRCGTATVASRRCAIASWARRACTSTRRVPDERSPLSLSDCCAFWRSQPSAPSIYRALARERCLSRRWESLRRRAQTDGDAMSARAWAVDLVFLALLVASAFPVGAWLARVLDPARPLAAESTLFRRLGIVRSDQEREMTARGYGTAFLLFNFLGTIFVYGVQRLQIFYVLHDYSRHRRPIARGIPRSASRPIRTGNPTPARRR